MIRVATARQVFEIVRTNIDRVPLSGEVTSRDEDVLESPSRTVSDKQLLQYINDGQRLLAEGCKALYLRNRQRWIDDSYDGLIASYEGPISGFDQEKMARPLVGRVEREAGGTYYSARKRSVAEHNYLEASGRKATPKRPAYTVSGGRLQVYPGDDPAVRVDYVAYPDKLTLGDIPSDPSYVGSTDFLAVGSPLVPALTMYVTAKAQRSLERIGLHDLYMNLFDRLVRPFERSFRIGRPDEYGRSRPDEPEVNTEV